MVGGDTPRKFAKSTFFLNPGIVLNPCKFSTPIIPESSWIYYRRISFNNDHRGQHMERLEPKSTTTEQRHRALYRRDVSVHVGL